MIVGYVIHKRTRAPGKESYSGGTWDKAGIRSAWKPVYVSKSTAEDIADWLSQFNPVGFEVTEVEDEKQE